ncbi:hypothetical protein fugu_017356 [Takifugu bimaculatus]|uniref:ADGRF3/5-like N-terminal domain-containing protein n=1 Tax=Takifugu bimaculatus TaxID=433685 RepID=A0A4Z2BS10_9TELE|nr:hypothetical protein fugu_017356 [Takifugu bimaculatus]
MALETAGKGTLIILAVLCLDLQGNAQPLELNFEEASRSLLIHAALENASDYLVQVTLALPNLEYLQTVLNTLSFPIMFNEVTEINSINTTTVCTQTVSGNECRCQPSYVWPQNICFTYGTCDGIIGDTCSCINGLPPEGQLCWPNGSQPVWADLDVEVRVPLSFVPAADVFNTVRRILKGLPLPLHIAASVKIVDVAFTTGCASNTNETLQCHCEEQFFWSCDLCEAYGACKSPSVTGPCQCINQLPPDGQLCRATPNITQCPATTPGRRFLLLVFYSIRNNMKGHFLLLRVACILYREHVNNNSTTNNNDIHRPNNSNANDHGVDNNNDIHRPNNSNANDHGVDNNNDIHRPNNSNANDHGVDNNNDIHRPNNSNANDHGVDNNNDIHRTNNGTANDHGIDTNNEDIGNSSDNKADLNSINNDGTTNN